MITPAEISLTVYVGADFKRSFAFKDKTTKAALDMTGWTAKCQIRSSQSRTSTLIAEMTATVTDAAGGVVTLALTDTQTAAITAKTGQYGLILTDASGGDWPYLYGAVEFIEMPTII